MFLCSYRKRERSAETQWRVGASSASWIPGFSKALVLFVSKGSRYCCCTARRHPLTRLQPEQPTRKALSMLSGRREALAVSGQTRIHRESFPRRSRSVPRKLSVTQPLHHNGCRTAARLLPASSRDSL